VVSRSLRLGVVPYLNVAPIVHGLASDPSVTLVRDVPSRLRERLLAGEIDAGILPSIDYEPTLAIVPGIAIASRGPVRSVRLVHKVPLPEIRRVAVDSSSHASAALLRVLLDARGVPGATHVVCPPDLPDMLEHADAALLIGDAALFARSELPSLDLGAEWTSLTGLPFVYAFWASRPEGLKPGDVERLRGSLDAGLRALPQIASSYNGVGAGRAAECESYLRDCVVYRFGDDEKRGLLEFYRRAAALGLIESAPELRFHGHS
jgi:chorismate dehydratase